MLDADKQSAMNLFVRPSPADDQDFLLTFQLGVGSSDGSPPARRPNYRHWYNPSHLDPPKVDDLAPIRDVYKEYYKPHILSFFGRLYA